MRLYLFGALEFEAKRTGLRESTRLEMELMGEKPSSLIAAGDLC